MPGKYLQPIQLRPQSLAANFVTEHTDVTAHFGCVFQVVTAGVTDNTGEFVVQGTCVDDGTGAPSDWVDIEEIEIPVLANANGVRFAAMAQVPFPFLRLKFTAAGGTPDGTCKIYVGRK